MGDYTQVEVTLNVKPELFTLISTLDKAERQPNGTRRLLNRDLVKSLVNVDHEFFDKQRHTYFIRPEQFETESLWYVEADLKNYEDEINTFFDWVKDYVIEKEGTLLGTIDRPYANHSDNVYWRNGKFDIEYAPYDPDDR